MAVSFTDNMAKSILNWEQSPRKFEKFCCALYSRVDGWTYVPTSWNYDQGRDGRTTDANSASHPPVICVSLRQDAVKKAQEDATTLAAKKYKPKVIRFCVTLEDDKNATEHLLDKCRDIFFQTVAGVETVIVDGALQIAALAVTHPDCFEKFYIGELKNLRNALSVDAGNAEHVKITGMRIALTTQFSDDAAQLRDDLHKNLILSALSTGSHTLGKMCKVVSDALHLPKLVNADYLVAPLEALEASGYITRSNGLYSIAPQGSEELKKRTDEGASNLINGQQFIRDLILELTGENIPSEDFARLWNIVQDEIATMFLTNGIYVLQSVEAIITRESQLAEHADLHDSIRNLADRVAGLPIWGNRKADIHLAVMDMFEENDSQAFKWLAQLGTVYVSLCSLGLESTAQQQIEESLSNLDLLLDTDIVLSFLSKGEKNHDPIRSIVNSWQRVYGNIFVTPSVLEETAYHAWIAEREYGDIWRDLSKYDDHAAHRLINNAFVRGFRAEMIESRRYAPKYWRSYISAFRGKACYDHSRVESILEESYVFKTSDKGVDAEVAQTIEKTLLEQRIQRGIPEEDIDQEDRDKFHRDGLLIAVLLRHRQNKGKNALVVSSSTQLAAACKAQAEKLGSSEIIAPVSAVAYLLTMIPGVNMNLGTLKGLLFDTGYVRKIKGQQKVALRMIQASEEYFLPFSRRATLRKRLGDKISEMATQLNKKPEEVADAFEHGKLDIASTTHIVAEAIDSMTQSKYEKRAQEAERKLRELNAKDRR